MTGSAGGHNGLKSVIAHLGSDIPRLRIGVGMIPRGEVGMVVAQIGLGFGIISQSVYGIVVFMSVATTIVAPPLIKLAFAGAVKESAPDTLIMPDSTHG